MTTAKIQQFQGTSKEGDFHKEKTKMVNLEQLAQYWVRSHEEETQGSDVQIYRRENYSITYLG